MKIKYLLFFILSMNFSFSSYAEKVRVKDGDSLEIENRRIRLDGIDAPEFMQICQTSSGENYECGIEALRYLENLTHEKDVDCRCLEHKDRYNREICECFIDGVSINKEMVAAGWAVAYRDTSYLEAEESAEQNKRGIWQGKHMRPAIYRVLHRYEQ